MTGSAPAFARAIGIDYSGAETANSSLKGLRVYMADLNDAPREVAPPPSPKRYWTRRGIAEWLVERLAEEIPTVVGIDHAFSFPLRYFEVHGLLPDWPTFLDDFQRHLPTDADHTLGPQVVARTAPVRKFVADPRTARVNAIAAFVSAELDHWKDFFDTIESKPLMPEQRL